MIWLAIRLTFHNRTRLIVTLFGVVFAAYLTLTETALYIGMMENATSVIRHAGADLWVASKGVQNFDFAKPFPEDRAKALQSRRDILWAKPISLSWGYLKLPDGAQELVEIIGYDPQAPVGGPWDMASGRAEDVVNGNSMILDESAAQRLGQLRIGQTWEVNDKLLQLVGVSRGARTFTTAPIVFTSFERAQAITPDISRQAAAAYIAVKLRDAKDGDRIAASICHELKENEVLTTGAFVHRTILYWTVQTGMGAAFCLTALLGLVVGAGTIGQTVFANTMEHLNEFATLKAMGASARDLNIVILAQAGINACVGFLLAVPLVLLSKVPLETMGVTLAISPLLLTGLFCVIFITALLAAFFSIRRVQKLDPAAIFRSS